MQVGVSCVVLAISALAIPATRDAHADGQAGVDEVELRYTAPTECPGPTDFEAQIKERAAAARFVTGAKRVFEITITASADEGYVGILAVDGTEDKQLGARRCDDLATALALVVAIAIDPQAALGVERAPDPPPPAPPPAPPRSTPASSTHVELATTLGFGVGVTPDPLLAGILEARLIRDRFSLAFAVLGGRDSTTSDMAVAHFTWLAARPSACWVARFAVGVAACAHGEVGLTHAAGEDIVYARDLTRLWLAAGVHAGLQWPNRGRIFGQLELGASFPFLRDRYRFNPGTVIHSTGVVVGWVDLGVGVRF